MKRRLPLFLVCLPFLGAPLLQAKPKGEVPKPQLAANNPSVSQDDAVRVQLFLDAHNFGPGKIDGNYGGFTLKAWQYYQRSQGEEPKDTFDVKAAPLASSDPVYITYTVNAEDLGFIAPMPPKMDDQSKLKVMAYSSLSELLGERYHSAVKFLAKLNPGKNIDQLKEGEQVTVPNVVKPFQLAEVNALRKAQLDQLDAAHDKAVAEKEAAKKHPGRAKTAKATPSPSPSPALANADPAIAPPSDPSKVMIHVSVKDAYLEVHDGDKIVAGFPVTPGSKAIPSPVGEWKIDSKTLLPVFRWDKSMLMTGKRSSDFKIIPPGPNNPVGIAWIALNKEGIGLHGTNDPETIGRAASHGCIRLANWDEYKLFGLVQKGEKVVIE